jgi:SPP1 family predicted phage head-tail adaptor
VVAIGARNIRGTLEGPTKVTLPSGQVQVTFGALDDASTEWAEVRPLRGNEYLRAQQVFGEMTAPHRIHYRSYLTDEMRFVADRGDVWDFKSPPVDPDGRRRELEIMAVKRV